MFSDLSEKQKLDRWRWVLASFNVSSNCVRWHLRRCRKCERLGYCFMWKVKDGPTCGWTSREHNSALESSTSVIFCHLIKIRGLFVKFVDTANKTRIVYNCLMEFCINKYQLSGTSHAQYVFILVHVTYKINTGRSYINTCKKKMFRFLSPKMIDISQKATCSGLTNSPRLWNKSGGYRSCYEPEIIPPLILFKYLLFKNISIFHVTVVNR